MMNIYETSPHISSPVIYADSMSHGERFIKRLADIVVSGVGMVVLSPFFLLIWLLICLGGGQPVYKQERIGYRGRPFYILKFRPMRKDVIPAGTQHMFKKQDSIQIRICNIRKP